MPALDVDERETTAEPSNFHEQLDQLTDSAAIHLGHAPQIENEQASPSARHQFREVNQRWNGCLDDQPADDLEHH